MKIDTEQFVNALPLLQSKVALGLIVSIVLQVAGLFGHHLDAGAITDLLSTISQLLSLAAGAYALTHRVTSPIQPIVMTQNQADIKNSSAAIQTAVDSGATVVLTSTTPKT